MQHNVTATAATTTTTSWHNTTQNYTILITLHYTTNYKLQRYITTTTTLLHTTFHQNTLNSTTLHCATKTTVHYITLRYITFTTTIATNVNSWFNEPMDCNVLLLDIQSVSISIYFQMIMINSNWFQFTVNQTEHFVWDVLQFGNFDISEKERFCSFPP